MCESVYNRGMTKDLLKLNEKLLTSSIYGWEDKIDGTETDAGEIEYGASHCPLCHHFNGDDTEYDNCCKGCAIAEYTGVRFCHDTPFDDFEHVIEQAEAHENGVLHEDDIELLKKIQKREISFLKKVLKGVQNELNQAK